jgi:hypothetical protein
MEIAVILLGGLLVVAAGAWAVKLMLKPAVIITVFAAMGWMMWYSGLGQGGNTPNQQQFQQQMERSLNDQ